MEKNKAITKIKQQIKDMLKGVTFIILFFPSLFPSVIEASVSSLRKVINNLSQRKHGTPFSLEDPDANPTIEITTYNGKRYVFGFTSKEDFLEAKKALKEVEERINNRKGMMYI